MGSMANTKVITILHFNDVYNIEERETEPVGGAARFVTAIRQMEALHPLVLFSGDAFNPSLMSQMTKGKQMVPVLNACNVQCAVYGNHDFDFGIDTLVELAEGTTFPWLLSNVVDLINDEPLAEGKISHIIEWDGVKLGLVGLVEEEWIDTLSTIDPDDIKFLDYVEEGKKLAAELKAQGADYIIALTHMRWPNDTRLAEKVPEIDIILGGHDHDYNIKQVNGKYVLKSGTDFREMSKVTLTFDSSMKASVEIEKIVVDSSIPADEEIMKVVQENKELMGHKLDDVLGHVEVEMDGRFENIRTQETNLGNFITDIMLTATDAEVAILNSGTLRSDAIHPKGPFRMKDLMAILPFVDPIVVIKCSADQLIRALENSVSQWPKMEGRFAQVGGLTFGFDPNQPPGNRIDKSLVRVQGEYLDEKRAYKVATKAYLLEGKDGYDVFKECEVVVDAEEGPRLSTQVQNHFLSVKMIKGEKKPPKHGHRPASLIPVTRRKSLVQQLTISEVDTLETITPENIITPSSHPPLQSRRSLLRRRSSIESVEMESAPGALAPEVEGRIYILNTQRRRVLEDQKLSESVRKTAIAEED